MNTNRRRVEAIVISALELKTDQRQAYLDVACSNDADLRREVESLLAQESGAKAFLETPALEAAARALAETRSDVLQGRLVGPYRIDSLIGAGGMGEVYRATDTRLHRTVAIKVLPPERISDPERKRRFLQEARAASALNHPNIITLHDIASDNGVDYIVMEYVRGKSLDKLIKPKGMPLAEALGYAQQIACALAVAHGAGIVHRDIKPPNVIVTPESQVKVLDFGLAKLVERAPGAAEPSITDAGTVMGTASYMSPEQAAGRELDHRTDIFSLGIVLFEMLSGARPFRGKSEVETMAAIINDPAPALEQPFELQNILEKALAKDPKDRYQHAGDFALDLNRFRQRPAEARQQTAPKTPVLAWIACAALLLAMPVVWWTGHHAASTAQTAPANDVSITPFTTNLGYNGEATISPDGQTIAYVSDRKGRLDIFLRQIGTSSDIALTNDQGDNIQPAYSPDGRQIAFVSSRAGASAIYYPGFDNPMMGGDIWTMPALGGTARRVVKDGNFPSWSPDGSKIVFVRYRGMLCEVSASGGEAREIKLPDNSRPIYYPTYSSDSRWIFIETNGIQAVRASDGVMQQIASGRHPVWDDASQAVIYSDDREGNNYSLWSIPFSLQEGKPTGNPRALTVGRGRDWQPAVSKDGKLVTYTAIQMSFNLETVPFDAESGRVLGAPRLVTTGNQVSYFMRFSPDGRSVVFQSSRGAGQHIWRVDIGSEPVQLTSDPKYEESFPHWSPDATTIAFIRQPAQSPKSTRLFLMDTDGANPRKILDGISFARWLPDGSGLLYQDAKNQVFLYELRNGQSRQVSIQPDLSATMIMPSPDGKWLAYQAGRKEAGNVDVHVVRMDGGESRDVVATPQQDYHPFFSPSGRWLYFQPDHKNLFRVPGPAQDWKPADPVKITDFPESGLYLEDPQFSRDGKQFLYARGKITGDIWLLRRAK